MFAALVLYIRRHPFPGFGGFTNIGIIALSYAFSAFVVFKFLYGKKPSPWVVHADRLYGIGVAVKFLRLHVHRSLRVRVARLDAVAAAFERMGSVRCQWFLCVPFHRHYVAAAPAEIGWARLRRATASWHTRPIRVTRTRVDVRFWPISDLEEDAPRIRGAPRLSRYPLRSAAVHSRTSLIATSNASYARRTHRASPSGSCKW